MQDLWCKLIVVAILPIYTSAHVQLSYPYPFRSSLNPHPSGPQDFSNRAPLLADGSDFPCKRYHLDPTSSTTQVTYTAGSTYNITFQQGQEASAPHGGGSCQISLSYDNAATWKVIKSMIGGCPLQPGYNFTVPALAPSSGSAMLAWTWFNKIGNREMYMNCVRVEVQGQHASRRQNVRNNRRQNSMSSLPDMFACNVANGCHTVETQDVHFPNPGPDVVYGQDLAPPSPGNGFTGGSNVQAEAAGPSSATSTAAATQSMPPIPSVVPYQNTTATATTPILSTNTTSPSATVTGFATVIQTTTLAAISPSIATSATMPVSAANGSSQSAPATTGSASTIPSPILLSGPCTPGVLACNSASSFSRCIGGAGGASSYIYMGQVPAGMQCVDSKITRQNDGPCTPDGQLFCKGESSYQLCDQGGLLNMGPVAPGTKCVNGTIVRA